MPRDWMRRVRAVLLHEQNSMVLWLRRRFMVYRCMSCNDSSTPSATYRFFVAALTGWLPFHMYWTCIAGAGLPTRVYKDLICYICLYYGFHSLFSSVTYLLHLSCVVHDAILSRALRAVPRIRPLWCLLPVEPWDVLTLLCAAATCCCHCGLPANLVHLALVRWMLLRDFGSRICCSRITLFCSAFLSTVLHF